MVVCNLYLPTTLRPFCITSAPFSETIPCVINSIQELILLSNDNPYVYKSSMCTARNKHELRKIVLLLCRI